MEDPLNTRLATPNEYRLPPRSDEPRMSNLTKNAIQDPVHLAMHWEAIPRRMSQLRWRLARKLPLKLVTQIEGVPEFNSSASKRTKCPVQWRVTAFLVQNAIDWIRNRLSPKGILTHAQEYSNSFSRNCPTLPRMKDESQCDGWHKLSSLGDAIRDTPKTPSVNSSP